MSSPFSPAALKQWAPVLVLLALVVLLAVIEPRFLSLRNFARIGLSATPALMIAIGVTFVILMGSIDLSMEGTVAVVAVTFALAFLALGGTAAGPGLLAVPMALAVGAFCGLLTGLAHVRLRIPSFMASLAMGFVGAGVALVITGGERIRIEDEAFRSILTVRLLDLPVMVWMGLAALGVAWFIQNHTAVGRNIYAVGGGEELALASGVRVDRVRLWAFTIAGVFYALGALFAVARIGIAETATGSNFMFVSITSVVVGGTLLWGGAGGVLNTLVGVLIVNVINNGMIIVGLPRFVQDGVLGLMVIAAVVLSTDRRRMAFVK